MPFSGPQNQGPFNDFDDCVESMQDEEGIEDPEALCAEWARAAGESLTAEQEQHLVKSMQNIHQLPVTAKLSAGPGAIQRTENSDSLVRYSDVMLLAPGTWTDAASRTPLEYPAETIKKFGDNPAAWENDQLNLDHDLLDGKGNKAFLNVGKIDTSSLYTDRKGRLYGDLVLHGDNQASRDAVKMMDRALETEGELGIGGPSVEVSTDQEIDRDTGKLRATEMRFHGAALVMQPASDSVDFGAQAAERAVALSESVPEKHVMVQCPEKQQDLSNGEGEEEAMTSKLQETDEDDKLEAVQDQVAVIAEILNIDEGDVMNALDPVLPSNDAEEEEEEPGEEMQEPEEPESGSEEEPGAEEEPGEEEEASGELGRVKQRLEEMEKKIDELMTIVTSGSLSDMPDAVEEIDKRLSKVEKQPQIKALAKDSSNDAAPAPVLAEKSEVDRDEVTGSVGGGVW